MSRQCWPVTCRYEWAFQGGSRKGAGSYRGAYICQGVLHRSVGGGGTGGVDQAQLQRPEPGPIAALCRETPACTPSLPSLIIHPNTPLRPSYFLSHFTLCTSLVSFVSELATPQPTTTSAFLHTHSWSPLQVIGQTDEFVAVCKPACMPVHTVGQYRKNTVLGVLQAQCPELGTLYPTYR